MNLTRTPNERRLTMDHMDKTEIRVSFVARTDNPTGFRELLVSILDEEYGLDISDITVDLT